MLLTRTVPNYFSQIYSLRSALTFIPSNFLLFIANNIISNTYNIAQVTKTEKEWDVMKMMRILCPSHIIWAFDDLLPI